MKYLRQSVLVGAAIFGLASTIPLIAQAMPVHAEEAQTNSQEKETTGSTSSTESEQSTSHTNPTEDQKTSTAKPETETENENSKDASQTRLADAKLKACENRQQAITNIMARLNDRGQKQIDLFSAIAERTEAFYKAKGNTLANYDALVADVATNKTAAQAAVDATKSASGTFKCDGINPKGIVSVFKSDLKAEITALNSYKTSVKNLIVGVKSVQSTTTSNSGGAN